MHRKLLKAPVLRGSVVVVGLCTTSFNVVGLGCASFTAVRVGDASSAAVRVCTTSMGGLSGCGAATSTAGLSAGFGSRGFVFRRLRGFGASELRSRKLWIVQRPRETYVWGVTHATT